MARDIHEAFQYLLEVDRAVSRKAEVHSSYLKNRIACIK